MIMSKRFAPISNIYSLKNNLYSYFAGSNGLDLQLLGLMNSNCGHLSDQHVFYTLVNFKEVWQCIDILFLKCGPIFAIVAQYSSKLLSSGVAMHCQDYTVVLRIGLQPYPIFPIIWMLEPHKTNFSALTCCNARIRVYFVVRKGHSK